MDRSLTSVHVLPVSVAGHVPKVDDPPLQAAPEHEIPTTAEVTLSRFAVVAEPRRAVVPYAPGDAAPFGVNTDTALSRFAQNHRFVPPCAPPGPTWTLDPLPAANVGETNATDAVLPLPVLAITVPGRPLTDV